MSKLDRSKPDHIADLLIDELAGPGPRPRDFATLRLTPKLNPITLAMLALGPGLAMLNTDLPLHECIALGGDPKIIEIGERFILLTVMKLASGVEVSREERRAVSLWVQQRITKHPRWYKKRRSGRPGGRAKAVAVRLAYADKMKNNPSRKREAIIRELEQDFGLKRRRILAMIAEIDQLINASTYSP